MQASLYEYLKNTKDTLEQLIVADDKAAKLASSVCSFCDITPFVLPDIRAFYGDDIRSFQEEFFAFKTVLSEFYVCKTKKILITPIRTSLLPFPKPELLQYKTIEFAQSLPLPALRDDLYYFGYEFLDLVELQGEVSVRGDIVDIFPINSPHPYRISLFDDEIDSIKAYDPHTQKTINEELESIRILPAFFYLSHEQYAQIEETVEESEHNVLSKDIASIGIWHLGDLAFCGAKKWHSFLANESIKNELKEILTNESLDIEDEPFLSLSSIPEPTQYKDLPFSKDYAALLSFHKDKKITLLCANETILKQHDVHETEVAHKLLERYEQLSIIGKDELIISVFNETKAKKQKKNTLLVDELKVGDYVVHHTHGIGIFRGIEHTKVLGFYKDYVSIAYQNSDKLLIPTENLDSLDRYIVDSGSTPSVDKLGKSSFTKLKQKAKKDLLEIADNIITMAANRELMIGKEIVVDYPLMQRFQDKSGFVYTKDQSRSVEDILQEISGERAMDRLLVGDVGFGKTEVALNTTLAVALSGLQVLFVAPTTLLVSQHAHSLEERLGEFGISVAAINRFTSAKEKKQIFTAFEEGRLQVLLGTHAIFKATPSNLGLVIIDEEHKFGVKQKEHLKNITSNVHLLSMSATPIPRSLNLALSHIKTISYLNTPPSDRKPVRTYVKEYSEILLKEIVIRELRRGGQIFYIHNHIATIDEKASLIQELLPNVKLLTLHSKMPSAQMQESMEDFENKKYDMLLSTTIIESGIHIPNVNTIIIDGSDRFGLADLHQLRGRVGRSGREGFCYFFVEDKETITEDAKKRLIALESNSELGSGYVIARSDLEIRGAGNILGIAQSGNIKGIGYGLYIKMLEECLQQLNEQEVEEEQTVDIRLAIDKFISSDLISEDRLRLDLYRRLSMCSSELEVYEIEEEIIDRFGSLDENTKNFLQVILIKVLAKKLNVSLITNYEQTITIAYHNEENEQRIQSNSSDSDDIVNTIFRYLKNRLSNLQK